MYDLLGSDKISLNSFRFPYFKVCLHNSNLRQQQKENLFTRPPKEHSTIIIKKTRLCSFKECDAFTFSHKFKVQNL